MEFSQFFILFLTLLALSQKVYCCHWKHRCKNKYGCIRQRTHSGLLFGETEDLEEQKFVIIHTLIALRFHPVVIQCTVSKMEEYRDELPIEKKQDYEERVEYFLSHGKFPRPWRNQKHKYCGEHANQCLYIEICMLDYISEQMAAVPTIAVLKRKPHNNGNNMFKVRFPKTKKMKLREMLTLPL